MPCIRLVFLWHMHQPFYKDLVTGEYRLPWVRLHALKDYYGMVKLLEEFPGVHQTFNLVPSLIEQIQDYVDGTARDPFFNVASKPAQDLTPEERRFALAYLFQTNAAAIARYPRYQELLLRFRGLGESPERAWTRFDRQDYADLQVLSQIAWFDEYFLDDPDIAALIEKGSSFDESDQALVIAREREILWKVLPAHAEAAQRGSIEISTSPHYHPILPLLCDTDAGGISTPGLKLPQRRFRHPEDARTQLERGLALHERTFGLRPRGAWPSEGSVSEPVLEIASQLGFEWLATDEGVLGRSIGYNFEREGNGRLTADAAQRLYRVYRYEKGATRMHLLFRDHVLSDLIGFVYSGMPAEEAAENFIHRIKSSAKPVLDSGRDAVVPIILDGENAWEYYPQSGREFLRRLYDGFERDPQIQAVTVSEAIHGESTAELPTTRGVTISVPADLSDSPQLQQAALSLGPVRKPLPDRRHFARLDRLVPGSWINANFNVWIGAPEDNRAWDYLAAARDFYANQGITASDAQRALAFEEILIAEGSDWNWWYGPEHHSANDRDFDELYRKHLSNVYLALNARPPDYLAQPILFEQARPTYTPQTGYIHPRIGAEYERYFEWIGAAMYTADRRAGAMHGKQFLLDSVYAGVDEENLYGRLDFASLPEGDFELRVTVEANGADGTQTALTLEVAVANKAIALWMLRRTDDASVLAAMNGPLADGLAVALRRNFTFKMPLAQLNAVSGTNLRLRFALWRDRLPLDALPVEGWMDLVVAPEEELEAGLFNYSVH